MDKPDNPYKPGTILYRLMDGDWSGLTIDGIAAELNAAKNSISQYIRRIRQDTGYIVPYAYIEKPKYEQLGVMFEKIPSYQKSKPAVQAKCTSCWNKDCSLKWRAVCWIHCKGYSPEPKKGV